MNNNSIDTIKGMRVGMRKITILEEITILSMSINMMI